MVTDDLKKRQNLMKRDHLFKGYAWSAAQHAYTEMFMSGSSFRLLGDLYLFRNLKMDNDKRKGSFLPNLPE